MGWWREDVKVMNAGLLACEAFKDGCHGHEMTVLLQPT